MNDLSSPLGFVAPEPSDLAPLFPAYEIHHLIATGGMGAVYQAEQKSLERTVALKILPMEFSEDAEFCAGFEAEAKAMARLNHPNLIGVHDFGEVNGMLFIVMEFVPGKSIYHSAYGKAIDPAEVIRLVTGVCNGLAHAHENGILHRDIKPSNILLTQQAEPKIGDFGLAHPVEHKTQAGEIVYGTPGYTAPEVVEHPDHVDHRADLFSVGVFLHELLTGKLPADDTRPASVIAGCDIRFDAIIRRATDPLPANRYSSAAEIATELQKITLAPKAAPAVKGKAAVASPSAGAARPAAGVVRPAPPRRTATMVKKKSSSLKWVGPLIAISIMAGCWYFFLNMKPKVVEIKKTAAETEELKEFEKVRGNVSESPKSNSQPTPEPVAQQYVYLDDLTETEAKIGYRVLGKHGAGPERSDAPAFVNGIKLDHSLLPHPPSYGSSRVSYDLNGEFAEFSGTATVSDVAHQRSLTFRIKGEGKLLWTSRVINTGKDAEEFNISVAGIKKLELEIECPGEFHWARGMWVSPRLSVASNPSSHDKANSPGVANSAQQEVFRQFQGVYQDGWACWYLFAVNAEGKVEGFQAGTDRISLIEGTIKNGEFNSKWTQTRSNYAHDFTYQLLPDLNISLSGTFGLPSGRQNHGKSVAIRVTDNNRCLRILDMANSLAKTEQEKSVLSRLRLPYLPPLYAAKSNPIVPTKVTGTQPKGIPSDATYFNSKWYRVYEDKKNWTEARDICRSQGGQLVLVPDDATQTFIKKLSGGKMLWLGATDEKQEGEWLWVDGTKMSYNYFHPVEPNNVSRIEHYLVINFRNIDGFWCDFPDKVSEVVGYICEWPDKPVVLPEEKDLSVIAVASPKTVAAAQPLTVPSTNRIFSDFEKDADGWIGINNKNEPENLIHESGGAISSSKKYISVSERGGDGNLCFFAAPAKYLGDKKSTYRGNIQLYIRQAANSSFWSPYGLIVLKSKGNELQYRINQPPSSTAWSNFDISLCENAGWVDIATGSNVTKEKFLEVLGLIESLWVLAEYSGNKYDWAGLDDFTLNDRDKSVSLEKVQDIVGTWNYSSSVVMEIKPDGKIYSNSKLTGKWSQRDKITEYYIVLTDGSTHIGTIDKYKRMLSIASRARGVGQSMARIDNGPTKNFDVPNQIMAWRMEFNNLKQDITSMEARLQVTRRSAAEYWHKHHEAKALGRLSRWNIQAEQAENAARGIEQNIKDHHTLVEKIQIKLGGN